jgi:hypothetical protein
MSKIYYMGMYKMADIVSTILYISIRVVREGPAEAGPSLCRRTASPRRGLEAGGLLVKPLVPLSPDGSRGRDAACDLRRDLPSSSSRHGRLLTRVSSAVARIARSGRPRRSPESLSPKPRRIDLRPGVAVRRCRQR